MHLNYRPAHVEWGQRQGWADRSHTPSWYQFVHRATARQLALFGFPPPGHPYWTPQTPTGVQQRYRGLDPRGANAQRVNRTTNEKSRRPSGRRWRDKPFPRSRLA
jgi:hypothetical protein